MNGRTCCVWLFVIVQSANATSVIQVPHWKPIYHISNVSHDYMSGVWWHAARDRQSSNISPCILDRSIWITIAGDLLNSNQHGPDNKVHGANMGPTWVLSAPDGPHVGPMNLSFRGFAECPNDCAHRSRFVIVLRMSRITYLRIFLRITSLAWVNHTNAPVPLRQPRRIPVNEQYKIIETI